MCIKAALRKLPGYHTIRFLRHRWTPRARLSAQSRAYDEELRAVMYRTLRPDRIGVDVGANVGDILAQMCAASAESHLAVEPIPELAHALQRRCPQARILACALSDTSGRARFRVVKNSLAESSLLATDTHVVADAEWIDVDVCRLDDVVLDTERIGLLKIDAEGAELPILRGATAVLKRDTPVVVFEAGGNTTPHFGVTPDMIWRFFQERGYVLTTMREWLDGRPAFSEDEFSRRYIRESGTDVLPWVGPRKDWMFLAAPSARYTSRVRP